MNHTIWSFLLVVCAAQCLFLLTVFIVRPPANKKSSALLLVMLAIILCTTMSNLWSSFYLYRQVPEVAGFARGMVLLLGPVLYLYILAVTDPEFSFRPIRLLHFAPYLTALLIIKLERAPLSYPAIIANIDKLMEGRIPITGLSIFWFVAYFIHLLIYIIVAHTKIRQSVKKSRQVYLIPLEQRISWLKKLSFFFKLIVVLFLCHTLSIIITGTGSIITNYIYNIVLAFIVYRIGFQAIADNRLLSPGFSVKYKSAPTDEQWRETLVKKLLHLFEKEKVFTDPDLNLASLAQKTGVHSHLISQTINHQFNQSFNDLMNFYRIDEFKKRVRLREYAAYSIIGLAYDVGYKSKSSFNSAFKKQTGITPSEYVKSVS